MLQIKWCSATYFFIYYGLYNEQKKLQNHMEYTVSERILRSYRVSWLPKTPFIVMVCPTSSASGNFITIGIYWIFVIEYFYAISSDIRCWNQTYHSCSEICYFIGGWTNSIWGKTCCWRRETVFCEFFCRTFCASEICFMWKGIPKMHIAFIFPVDSASLMNDVFWRF